MKQTIALVDDDRNILTSISIALEKEGFVVQTYLDGEILMSELLNTNFVINLLFLILMSILPPCIIGMYFKEKIFEISAK